MRILLFAICVVLASQQCSGEKLNIEVLYESLCPDSVNFISNQLEPTYKEIAKYVNIIFVPFGKASSNNEEFECQHGPKECQGNRIQSCVLNVLDEQEKQVEYVKCFMTSYYKNKEELGQHCAEHVGVHWETVKQCYESQMGTKLQLEAEKETIKYYPQFIPAVIYDKTYNQKDQDESIRDFREYVCSRLQKDFPNACLN